jgi:hypothetical protein
MQNTLKLKLELKLTKIECNWLKIQSENSKVQKISFYYKTLAVSSTDVGFVYLHLQIN